MDDLTSTYSKSLAEIDLRFDGKRKEVEANIEQSKQEVVDLYESYGFSPNAIRDFDKVLLDDERNYPLPYALQIGSLTPKNDGAMYGQLQIPAILPFTEANATAFMIDHEQNNDEAIQHIMQLIAFRLMLTLPVGLCRFHFVDTHSFGKKFSTMNRLSEKIMDKALVHDETRLTELITELEQTIIDLNQNQLTRYATLEDYDRDAGSLAVPYHFVFITDFPHAFSNDLAKRFYKLIQNKNATKAGVYIFFSFSLDRDKEKEKENAIPLSQGVDVMEYVNMATLVYPNEEGYYEVENTIYDKQFYDMFNIRLQTHLPPNLETLIDAINRKANNVKQPIISMDAYLENLMQSHTYWKENSRLGIKMPIGKRPVDETVYLELGGDTADYFAMVGGRPGFGKTVLLHNIICNASILYSPVTLNFYLIDCTNGTGFKPYDKLPHAVFVSITNQREYTVSALEHLIDEMYRRADLFKNAGEQSGTTIEKIEEYLKITSGVMPRLLVIIDEFQVLLESGDKISRQAGFYLEKIIREGRKYGIHIIFCTQSYRNLDFNTDLITLRIAFNLKEYDSMKVLGGSNEAATTLTKKGEAILNNKNGNVRDNMRFQCAYTAKILDYVNFCNSKMSELAGYSQRRFVFDGTENSDLSANTFFTAMLTARPADKPVTMQPIKVYVGAPSFIRHEPAYFKIRNNPCSNLLMAGNDTEAAMTCLMLANYQIAKQSPANSRCYIVDYLSADDERAGYFPAMCNMINNVHYCKKRELPELLESIEQELNLRIENDNNGISYADRGRIVLTISYIQNAKELKKEGYMPSPLTEKMTRILKNGPDTGIHTLVYSYTCKGLEEVFDRMTWNEFENRIVLAEGGGKAILSEPTSEPKGRGFGLIQTDDASATYNPDPFVFYSRYEGESGGHDGEILRRIFDVNNKTNLV